ncbi:MAG: hypothetical protein IH626_22520 [Rhodospirillales bacterium]|nr:hypothetical protein [Rhodospirillales bacterium]
MADLIRQCGALRGLAVRGTRRFTVWPADQNWHVEMAGHLEGIGEIDPNAALDRLVIADVADAWFLYRDEP